VIYLDSSVALAHLFAEDRAPTAALWREPLISSRLLQYEIWNRINAHKRGRALEEDAQALINRVSLLSLTSSVLQRALEPLPVPVRTLDALHLASIEFLRREHQSVELASYDKRLLAGARALGIAIWPL
jgi:predicted nucleic acid-binding protein